MTDPTRDPATALYRGPAGDSSANITESAPRGAIPAATAGRASARHRRATGWRSRDVVRAAGLVFAMYLALQLLWLANALFLTVFLGILFAIAISAGVDRLQRFRIPRGIGAALIVVIFFALLSGFGAWVAPTLRAQGAELRVKLPQAVDRAQEWMNKRQSGIFGVLLGGSAAPKTEPAAAAPPPAATPSTAGAAIAPPQAATPSTAAAAAPATGAPAPGARSDSTVKGTPSIKGRLSQNMTGMSRYLFPFLTSTLEAVGGIDFGKADGFGGGDDTVGEAPAG